MSLINQVLNQLDRRGAESAADMTLVRAVHGRIGPRKYILPALLVVVTVALLAWQMSSKPGRDIPVPVVIKASPTIVLPAPISSVAAASDVSKHDSSFAATSGVNQSAPVFQLSFELSSVAMQVPEPVVAREQKIAPVPPKAAAQPALQSSARTKDKPADKSPDKPTEKLAAAAPVNETLPMKQISPKQQAEAEFRKAVLLMQQGRVADAMAGFEAALNLDASHDQARQSLVALLVENKRAAEAERVLADSNKARPEKLGFVMMAARLQVERGAVNDGVATLEHSLPFAAQQADYHAFLAALLQRQARHKEAIDHYQIALQQMPDNGLWCMGMGISLQAAKRNPEAVAAYQRALATRALRPELQDYVRQRLQEL